MAGKDYFDPVVDIRPLRVMIHRLGLQGDLSHKCKSPVEIFEGKGSRNGVPVRSKLPIGEVVQGLLAAWAFKAISHGDNKGGNSATCRVMGDP